MPKRELNDQLESCVGFEWDEWNIAKNWEKHRVAPEEAEAVFFHDPLMVRGDTKHSSREKRYLAIGETPGGRRLLIAFTVRKKLIRVISARDVNRREDEAYTRYEEENS